MILNFHSSAAETASGASDSFKRSDMALVGLFVNVSAVSGVLPTLVVRIQHSPDGENWYNMGSIATSSINATGTYSATPAALGLLADFIRVSWIIGGANPSFTFSADVVVKCT